MNKTPLFNEHVQLNGKIIDFAGWELPVEYSGILNEHHAVRKAAGLFDVSHMGEVDVLGKDAAKFVQNLVTNDVSLMANHQIIYCCMCYPTGGVVDDLLVYKRNAESFYLVINASNVDKDYAWMQENSKGFDVKLINLSPNIAEVAFQGPLAQEVLQTLTDYPLDDITFFTFAENVMVAGVSCLVSRTGYTGEDGFEVYAPNGDIAKVWTAILEAGKDKGVLPCGLGCRDTLRFEASLPLYGNEIDKDITPLEAGLGIFVKLEGDDFIGKSVLVAQKSEGLKRKSVGFELIDKGIPRHGYPVYADGKEIGVVTTGYISPSLERTIGMALIDADYSALGTEIQIGIRKNMAKAQVVSKRFLTKNYKK